MTERSPEPAVAAAAAVPSAGGHFLDGLLIKYHADKGFVAIISSPMTAAHKTGPDRKGILYIYSQIVFYAVAIKSAIPFYPVLSRLCTVSVYTRVLALFDQLKFEISRILPLLKNLTLDVTPRPPYVISRVLRSAARILHSVFFAALSRVPPFLARTLFPGSGPRSPTIRGRVSHSSASDRAFRVFWPLCPLRSVAARHFRSMLLPPTGRRLPGSWVCVCVCFCGFWWGLCLFVFVSVFICEFVPLFVPPFLSVFVSLPVRARWGPAPLPARFFLYSLGLSLCILPGRL